MDKNANIINLELLPDYLTKYSSRYDTAGTIDTSNVILDHDKFLIHYTMVGLPGPELVKVFPQ